MQGGAPSERAREARRGATTFFLEPTEKSRSRFGPRSTATRGDGGGGSAYLPSEDDAAAGAAAVRPAGGTSGLKTTRKEMWPTSPGCRFLDLVRPMRSSERREPWLAGGVMACWLNMSTLAAAVSEPRPTSTPPMSSSPPWASPSSWSRILSSSESSWKVSRVPRKLKVSSHAGASVFLQTLVCSLKPAMRSFTNGSLLPLESAESSPSARTMCTTSVPGVPSSSSLTFFLLPKMELLPRPSDGMWLFLACVTSLSCRSMSSSACRKSEACMSRSRCVGLRMPIPLRYSSIALLYSSSVGKSVCAIRLIIMLVRSFSSCTIERVRSRPCKPRRRLHQTITRRVASSTHEPASA